MIGTLVCVFAMGFARTKPMLGLVLLYALSVMEGLLIGPMLGAIARGYSLGRDNHCRSRPVCPR